MSCGCNNTPYGYDCENSDSCSRFTDMSLPDFSCTPQVQKGKMKRYAMVEVRTNNSASNSNQAPSNGGATPTPINTVCPSNQAPFWSYTIDEIVTLPAVNGFFQIRVCNASQWRTSMWVQHPLGKFPITSIDTVLNVLTLRNSCDNNTPIPNNGAPGDTYNGPALIYPTDSACDRRDEVEDQVQEYLNETDEICNPNIPDLSGSERINLLGGLAECVDTCSGQTSPGTKCQRFAPQVFADHQTIQLPSAPERVLGSRTINGLSAPIQIAGIDPVNGQVIRLDIPSDGQYVLSVASGVATFAPQSETSLIYTSAKNVTSGAGSSSAKDLNTVTGVSVPSWATHAILECRAGIFSLGAQKSGRNTSNTSVSINGRVVAKMGENQDWSSAVFSIEPNGSDTNTVYAKLDGTSIAYNITQNADDGRNPIFDSYIKLVGFVKAVVEP